MTVTTVTFYFVTVINCLLYCFTLAIVLLCCVSSIVFCVVLFLQLFFRMACAFCYYGLVLMTTELFETSAIVCSDVPKPAQSLDTCAAECRQLQTTDYMDLLWTTLAEFPGIE